MKFAGAGVGLGVELYTTASMLDGQCFSLVEQ